MPKYKTGFCGIGLHEGTRPKSISGRPMKVCVEYDMCQCSCHEKISKMYKLAEKERVPQQNPDYEPAHNPDLTWLDEVSRGASIADGETLDRPVEVPSGDAAGLWVGQRTFTTTPTGVRARGQLEEQVRLVCNRFASGELDGSATPKAISEAINAEKPPSPGAIRAVFVRWEEIGFAIIKQSPLRFVSYTPGGMEHGLQALKAKHKRMGKK